MELYLVRHAQTHSDAGNGGQAVGPKDDLSAVGREQTNRLLTFFKFHDIQLLYSSQLQRALSTAAAIASNREQTPERMADARLNDKGSLDLAGREFPTEPRNVVESRVKSFLLDILQTQDTEHQNILLISHSPIITQIVACLEGESREAIEKKLKKTNDKFYHASVTQYTITQSTRKRSRRNSHVLLPDMLVKEKMFNNTDHL